MDFQITQLLMLATVALVGSIALVVPLQWHQKRGRTWVWFYNALGRVRFWKTVVSLVVLGGLASLCAWFAFFQASTGLPPWTGAYTANSLWAPVFIFPAFFISCVAVTCLVKALHASVLAGHMAAYHRMYTTVVFVLFCFAGAGMALGQSVPQDTADPRFAQVEIMTSGAQTVEVSVEVAGIPPRASDRAPTATPLTTAEEPMGWLVVEVSLRGSPNTIIDLSAVYLDLDHRSDVTVESGGFADVNVYQGREGNYESWFVDVEASKSGNCVMSKNEGHWVRSPMVIRARALLDATGSAKGWLGWDVKHSWTETTGGGRNTIGLPGIYIPVAVPGTCVIDTGQRAGSWKLPESATGSVNVAALLPVDAQISARPSLVASEDQPNASSLAWTFAFRSPDEYFPGPQYTIQTNGTTRTANIALFVAGLLAGGALGGIFDVSREWHTSFSLRAQPAGGGTGYSAVTYTPQQHFRWHRKIRFRSALLRSQTKRNDRR